MAVKHYILNARYCDAKGRELKRCWPVWSGEAENCSEVLDKARGRLLSLMIEETDTIGLTFISDNEESSSVEYIEDLEEGFTGVQELNADVEHTPEEIEAYQKELLKASGGILKDAGAEGLEEKEVAAGTEGKSEHSVDSLSTGSTQRPSQSTSTNRSSNTTDGSASTGGTSSSGIPAVSTAPTDPPNPDIQKAVRHHLASTGRVCPEEYAFIAGDSQGYDIQFERQIQYLGMLCIVTLLTGSGHYYLIRHMVPDHAWPRGFSVTGYSNPLVTMDPAYRDMLLRDLHRHLKDTAVRHGGIAPTRALRDYRNASYGYGPSQNYFTP